MKKINGILQICSFCGEKEPDCPNSLRRCWNCGKNYNRSKQIACYDLDYSIAQLRQAIDYAEMDGDFQPARKWVNEVETAAKQEKPVNSRLQEFAKTLDQNFNRHYYNNPDGKPKFVYK